VYFLEGLQALDSPVVGVHVQGQEPERLPVGIPIFGVRPAVPPLAYLFGVGGGVQETAAGAGVLARFALGVDIHQLQLDLRLLTQRGGEADL
jgi:hypothetical protein